MHGWFFAEFHGSGSNLSYYHYEMMSGIRSAYSLWFHSTSFNFQVHAMFDTKHSNPFYLSASSLSFVDFCYSATLHFYKVIILLFYQVIFTGELVRCIFVERWVMIMGFEGDIRNCIQLLYIIIELIKKISA